MSNLIKSLIMVTLLSVAAQATGLYVKVVTESMGDVEDSLQESFVQYNLKTVATINIYEKMVDAGLPKKMGKNWNTNNILGLKSFIVCNGKLGMNITNVNAMYGGMCPIKITLIEDKKGTSITYLRTADSTSDETLKKALKVLDDTVIKAIENADY